MPRNRCSAYVVSRHKGKRRSFLPLPEQAYLSWRDQLEMGQSDGRGLADASAAVVEKQEQRVIAPSISGPSVWFGENAAHVVGFEVGRRKLPRPLGRNRRHSRVLQRVGQIMADEVLEKAAEGRTPAIARGGRVRSVGLDMIKESCNRFGVRNLQRLGMRHRDDGVAR